MHGIALGIPYFLLLSPENVSTTSRGEQKSLLNNSACL